MTKCVTFRELTNLVLQFIRRQQMLSVRQYTISTIDQSRCDDPDTMTITALKTVAQSCSKNELAAGAVDEF